MRIILESGQIITILEKIIFLLCFGMLTFYQDPAVTWASVNKTKTEKDYVRKLFKSNSFCNGYFPYSKYK